MNKELFIGLVLSIGIAFSGCKSTPDKQESNEETVSSLWYFSVL